MRNIWLEHGQIRRGTPPAILRGVPELGIGIYDPEKKIGYLGSLESKIDYCISERAYATCEGILKRVKKDKQDPKNLYVVLTGDFIDTLSIPSLEKYDFSMDKRTNDHKNYRQEIVEFLIDYGFERKNIHDFFTKEEGLVQGIFLCTENGDVKIEEFHSDYYKVYEYISIEDCFKNIKRREFKENERPTPFHFVKNQNSGMKFLWKESLELN
jgi:hypothetical protein